MTTTAKSTEFEIPNGLQGFYMSDRMHFPEPVTPMMDLFVQVFNDGILQACVAHELPIKMRYQRINNYLYITMEPRVAPEKMEAQGKKAEAAVGKVMDRLWEIWDSEWRPELEQQLADWEAFDLGGASMPELLAHLDETIAKITRMWDIHFLWAFPGMLGQSLFQEFYQDLFGQEELFGAYRLQQGYMNKTLEADHALWGLSRKALASPDVREIFENNATSEVYTALNTTPEGRAFLTEFNAYLDRYGQRTNAFAELGEPGWIEDPATAIKSLKDFLAMPGRDTDAELANLASERERLIAETRTRINGYPEAVKAQFESLLKVAQVTTVLQEDHNYLIDQRGMYKVRLVLLEFGRRFAEAGVIEHANDVFYFIPDELRAIATALPQATDHCQVIDQRKAEMDRSRGMTAPPAVGDHPPGPPPSDPMSRAFGRFFGTPLEQPETSDEIRGNPGSPGKARGVAKVVLSLSQADKVEAGDILVAPGTMPAWTCRRRSA